VVVNGVQKALMCSKVLHLIRSSILTKTAVYVVRVIVMVV
jgi:hypothetical protein